MLVAPIVITDLYECRNYKSVLLSKNHKEFMILISQMILPFDRRPNLKEIINYFPKLKNRYEKVLLGKYSKSCEIPKFQDNVYMKILNFKSAPSTDIL